MSGDGGEHGERGVLSRSVHHPPDREPNTTLPVGLEGEIVGGWFVLILHGTIRAVKPVYSAVRLVSYSFTQLTCSFYPHTYTHSWICEKCTAWTEMFDQKRVWSKWPWPLYERLRKSEKVWNKIHTLPLTEGLFSIATPAAPSWPGLSPTTVSWDVLQGLIKGLHCGCLWLTGCSASSVQMYYSNCKH